MFSFLKVLAGKPETHPFRPEDLRETVGSCSQETGQGVRARGESPGTRDTEHMRVDISERGKATASGQLERKPKAAFGQMCYYYFHPKSNRGQGESR